MIRSVSLSLLLFLLPFVLYLLWIGLQSRRNGGRVPAQRKHLFGVTLAGVALAAIGFVVFTDFGGAEPGREYIPPRYENGVLIPGHFAPETP